jgi:hypothetical protein
VRTFTTMLANVGAEVQDTSLPFRTIIKEFINRRYFQILRSINWKHITPDYTFDTVAGTQEYILPSDFYKAINVRDTTNGFELAASDLQQLLSDFPDEFTDSGSPARYYILEDNIQEQPTAASVVAVVSSSASDTTQTVRVRGISSGVEKTETVTLNGVTPQNSTFSYTRLLGISKSAVTVGAVTCTTNAAAVTNATLGPETVVSFVKKIGLHYVPGSVYTISVPYIRKPLPLIEDSDYPVSDFCDLIELGSRADAWRYKRQGAKASDCESRFEVELQRYIWDQENEPNAIVQFRPTTYNQDNLY